MTEVRVMLCCNDPDNGNFVGRVERVEVEDEFVLDSCRWLRQSPALTIRDAEIKVSRRRFGAHGHARWVGNWCWDAVWMPLDEARRLVTYVTCDLGFSADSYAMEGPFADLFERPRPGLRREGGPPEGQWEERKP